jgi:hypothetical protein
MIFTAIQYTIISVIVISIFHYLISHFTNNLTVPKVRDLVSDTNAQYETILKQLQGSKASGGYNKTPIPHSSTEAAKQDLKDYLREQTAGVSSQGYQQSDDFDNPYDSNDVVYSGGQGDELAYSSY